MIAWLFTNLAFWRQKKTGHIHVAWQKLRVKSKKQAIQLYSPQTSKTTFHRAQNTNHSSFVLPNLLLSTLSHCSFARWNSSWAFSLFPFKDAATPAPACQPAWIVERTHPSWCMSNVSSKKLEKLRTPPGLYMLAARWQKASRMHEKNTHRMLWIVPYYGAWAKAKCSIYWAMRKLDRGTKNIPTSNEKNLAQLHNLMRMICALLKVKNCYNYIRPSRSCVHGVSCVCIYIDICRYQGKQKNDR